MTETTQWRGLHNHDRHFYSPGYGDRCGKCWYCSPETPCYCCLQAEVEALREKVKQHEVVFKVQAEALKSTREQVQRVRELHYNTATHHPSGCCSECGGTYPCPTVRALDGGAE